MASNYEAAKEPQIVDTFLSSLSFEASVIPGCKRSWKLKDGNLWVLETLEGIPQDRFQISWLDEPPSGPYSFLELQEHLERYVKRALGVPEEDEEDEEFDYEESDLVDE